jgi:hypothetical protein
MRFATLGLVAALSALGAAQNLLDRLPKCAQSCYANNQGDCNAIDIACICGNSTLISGLSCCVFESCNPEEQKSRFPQRRAHSATSFAIHTDSLF